MKKMVGVFPPPPPQNFLKSCKADWVFFFFFPKLLKIVKGRLGLFFFFFFFFPNLLKIVKGRQGVFLFFLSPKPSKNCERQTGRFFFFFPKLLKIVKGRLGVFFRFFPPKPSKNRERQFFFPPQYLLCLADFPCLGLSVLFFL